MSSLIVPICGKSTRFPDMRPKWMLTHPKGDFMVIAAILGLNLDQFDNIYFVTLQKYEDEYKFAQGLRQNLVEVGISKKSHILYLTAETSSQPETIYRAIAQEKIEGSIYIKDCDNYFEPVESAGNCINYCSLKEFDEVNPNNKSYIKFNKLGLVENIIEKEIISTTFCCGGYGFESAAEFCETFEKLNLLDTDLYISDIIYDMLLGGKIFNGFDSHSYRDWGTLENWNKYKRTYKTIFCDLDGTIFENSSSHFPPYIGESPALAKNIERLLELQSKEHLTIIFVTSRSEDYREITEKQLDDLGITYKDLIMGLPHSERILINDFSKTNPFPSASSINLIRNGDNLSDYL